MMMKSPSRNTRLLPTGGLSCARLASIHCRKLNACRDCMCPPCLSRMVRAAAKRGESHGREAGCWDHGARRGPGCAADARRLQPPALAVVALAVAPRAATRASPGARARCERHRGAHAVLEAQYA